jgi:competence protein ComEA
VLTAVSVLLIVVSIVLLIQSTRTVSPIEFSSDATPSAVHGTLTVDVEGAVAAPGIYTLPTGSRVEDALRVAGGLIGDADETYVARVLNRAGKLTDGAKIFVPHKSEQEKTVGSNQSESGGAGESAAESIISVNTASQAELESLPGIGPVTAGKIIANRPYMTLEELVTRNVIRPSLYEELKNDLTL